MASTITIERQVAVESAPARTAAPATANPAPLGLAGFAMTTFVLSMINSNAACAWYASFGAVVNSTFGRPVVPLFPLGR